MWLRALESHQVSPAYETGGLLSSSPTSETKKPADIVAAGIFLRHLGLQLLQANHCALCSGGGILPQVLVHVNT